MTNSIGALLLAVAIQTIAIATLLIRGSRRTRALRNSEERLRLILDRVPVMIWTARPDTTLDYLNNTIVEFTGLPIEKLLDNGWMVAAHPEDLEPALRIYYTAVEARTSFVAEYRVRRADGAYRWVLDAGVPKYGPDGSFTGYIGCVVDITERRDAEDLMREKGAALEVSHREINSLAGRLIEAQDTERARIARDLHDDVSQQLAGLSIALSSLKHRMDDLHVSEDIKEDLRAIHQRAATLAQNVRHLSHDLHPTVLRHAGLLASLDSHCAELGRLHGIVLTCRAKGDIAAIPPQVALCLYRIAQEALRNVIAHAGASYADVQILCTGDIAEITIADEGKGFDVSRTLEQGKGLGLVSIAERVRFMGGTVSVVAELNKGTRVRAQIPVHARVKTGSGAEGG